MVKNTCFREKKLNKALIKIADYWLADSALETLYLSSREHLASAEPIASTLALETGLKICRLAVLETSLSNVASFATRRLSLYDFLSRRK